MIVFKFIKLNYQSALCQTLTDCFAQGTAGVTEYHKHSEKSSMYCNVT